MAKKPKFQKFDIPIKFLDNFNINKIEGNKMIILIVIGLGLALFIAWVYYIYKKDDVYFLFHFYFSLFRQILLHIFFIQDIPK